MFIRVCFNGGLFEDVCGKGEIPSEVLVNPDCPIRIICSYLREVFRVDESYDVDLCDSEGNLIFMYEKEPWSLGLKYLKLKTTYYLVIMCKTEEVCVVRPLEPKKETLTGSATTTTTTTGTTKEVDWKDIMVRIKKQLRVNKSSRVIKLHSVPNFKFVSLFSTAFVTDDYRMDTTRVPKVPKLSARGRAVLLFLSGMRKPKRRGTKQIAFEFSLSGLFRHERKLLLN